MLLLMGAVLSAREVRRFTPASYEGAEGAPVYSLRPMNWRTRGRFRAALMGEGIRYPQDAEMARLAGELVDEAKPDNAGELHAVLDAYLAQRAGPGPVPPAEDAPSEERDAFVAEVAARVQVDSEYESLIDRLRQVPRMGFLLALRTAFNELAPALAASFTLVGWEGLPHAFRRRDDVVPDEVLELIPRADLAAIGSESLLLIALSESERGN